MSMCRDDALHWGLFSSSLFLGRHLKIYLVLWSVRLNYHGWPCLPKTVICQPGQNFTWNLLFWFMTMSSEPQTKVVTFALAREGSSVWEKFVIASEWQQLRHMSPPFSWTGTWTNSCASLLAESPSASKHLCKVFKGTKQHKEWAVLSSSLVGPSHQGSVAPHKPSCIDPVNTQVCTPIEKVLSANQIILLWSAWNVLVWACLTTINGTSIIKLCMVCLPSAYKSPVGVQFAVMLNTCWSSDKNKCPM